MTLRKYLKSIDKSVARTDTVLYFLDEPMSFKEGVENFIAYGYAWELLQYLNDETLDGDFATLWAISDDEESGEYKLRIGVCPLPF